MVTGCCQGWVGTGSGILTVSIDHVVTWAVYSILQCTDPWVSNLLPTGNIFNFFSHLYSTLKYLYNTTIEFVPCGNIYVKFYKDSNFKLQLSCTSCFTVDNVFVDKSSHLFKVLPMINGLSDHDSQYLTVNNILLNKGYNLIDNKRLITKATISNFEIC